MEQREKMSERLVVWDQGGVEDRHTQVEADDALQAGEKFSIAITLVISRVPTVIIVVTYMYTTFFNPQSAKLYSISRFFIQVPSASRQNLNLSFK